MMMFYGVVEYAFFSGRISSWLSDTLLLDFPKRILDTPYMFTHKNGNSAIVMKSYSTGLRCLRITVPGKETFDVPIDIAALGAGADAWLKDVICKCQYCPKETTVGHTDQAGVCQECFNEACDENARLDEATPQPIY